MSESRLAEGEYLELCYDKDITYSLKFQIDERMYYISIDLTTPISWIKDMAMCQIMGLGKRCNMVNISSGSLPKKIRHQDIDKLSNELRTTESVSSSQNGNIAMIEGSN